MTPDELKARMMAAAEFKCIIPRDRRSDYDEGREAENERLRPLIESLIDTVIEQAEALEKYAPYCVIQTGPVNEKGLQPFIEVWLAKEALTATRERLKAWVGE